MGTAPDPFQARLADAAPDGGEAKWPETPQHTIDTLFFEERRYPRTRSSPSRRTPNPTSTSGTSTTSGRERDVNASPGSSRSTSARVGPAVREVVPGREAQRLLQLRRPARRERQRRQGRLLLGGRARRGTAHDQLRRSPAGHRPVRERAEEARREEGNRRRDLHGDDSGAAGGDACMRPHRRTAHGGLRRILGRLPIGASERHGVRVSDHPGRRLAERRPCPAEAERGRSSRRVTGR